MAKRGPKEHKPTDEQRKLVETLAGRGLPQKMICALVDGVQTCESLAKHYRQELDTGEAKACAQVAGKLFEKCMEGDTASIIFWHKTRMGFKETNTIEHAGTLSIDTIVYTVIDPKNDFT